MMGIKSAITVAVISLYNGYYVLVVSTIVSAAGVGLRSIHDSVAAYSTSLPTPLPR